MGMNVTNERLRLEATFYNNMSVGLLVAGVLVPVFWGVFTSDPYLWFSGRSGTVYWGLIGLALAVLFGIGIACRVRADGLLCRLEDE
jgi:hypothetical protein